MVTNSNIIMNKVAQLTQELKKYAESLPDLTMEERMLPYIVGEPTYRAIYAPHGKKLEEYSKGQNRIALPSMLGGATGALVGSLLGAKFFGPKARGAGAIVGLVSGAGAGAALTAHSAPDELRKSLGEKE